MMTKKEFLQKLIDNEIYLQCKDPCCRKEPIKHDLEELYIGCSWTTGGMSGGDCWGNKSSARDPEPEPDFEILDKFLIANFPNLLFSQYLKLNSLIKTNEYSCSEYYGNYTDYKEKTLQLDVFYDFICSIN